MRSDLTNTFRATVSKHTGLKHRGEYQTTTESAEPRTVLGDTNLGPEAIAHAHAEEKKTRAGDGAAPAESSMWKFGDGQPPQLGFDYMPMPTKRGDPIRGVIDGKQIEFNSQIQLCAMYVFSPLAAVVMGVF